MSCNIAFFDQKKGVYERDFALPSLRIPLRVPKLYLGCFAELQNGIGVQIVMYKVHPQAAVCPGSNPCAFGSHGTLAVYAELQLYL